MSVLLTLLNLPLEIPKPTAPPGYVGQKITEVLGIIMWCVAPFCLGAAILSGGKIAAAHRRNEEGEGFRALGLAIIGLIICSSAATILTWFV